VDLSPDHPSLDPHPGKVLPVAHILRVSSILRVGVAELPGQEAKLVCAETDVREEQLDRFHDTMYTFSNANFALSPVVLQPPSAMRMAA